MTDKLDSGSKQDLITYRLSRAKDTLMEADYNADGGYLNAAVNRLYYACYYAASALMLKNNLEIATHAGIKRMLGLKFIMPGILEPEYGNIYQILFQNRQASDYEDFMYCTEDHYNDLRPMAEKFILRMENIINNHERV